MRLSAATGLVLITIACLTSRVEPAKGEETLPIGVFTGETGTGGFPKGWRPFFFSKIPSHTRYTVEQEGGRFVVKAESKASASMLYRDVTVDPKAYPIIRWRWRVLNLLTKADPAKKSGDDYPARLYVTFKDQTALNYLWESKTPKGTIVDNPYTSDVKMIVIESGQERLGQWVQEERNLYQDYRKAFGEEPPPVIAVAVMTDTDNTGESAVAFYADIVLVKR